MEINKCLTDPNTVLSDQYMPLAMMPAVVEAIQQGGSSKKYGPYNLQTASNITVASGGTKVISPTFITDKDGKSYYVPDEKEHVFEIRSLGITGYNLTLTGFSTVYSIPAEMTPTVSYRNDSGSSITVPAHTEVMEIYSDIPLAEYNDGGDT